MAAEPELIIRFKGDTKDLDAQLAKLKTSLAGLQPATAKVESGNRKLESSNASLGSSLGKLAAGYLSIQAAMSAGKFVLDATLQVEKFETQLKTASNGQADFGKNMAFLEDLSQTYKKNVVELGASFSQLTIATKGTALEGAETEKLFKAVTIASTALKMSTDDTTGTFRAFIQMVSKGNVQAEELRGQLGERLFGAFNIAARAMGKTTAELNGMLERGEVLASDLLPRMSDELLKTFSDDASEGAKSLGNNIEYAKGQLTLFIAELANGTGVTGFFSKAADDAGGLIQQLRILNKEVGAGAVALGLMESTFQTLFNNTGIDTLFNKIGLTGAATNFAKSKLAQSKSNIPISLGSKYPFPSRDKGGAANSLLNGASVIGELPKAQDIEAETKKLTEKQIKAAEKAKREREAAARRLANEEKKDAASRVNDLIVSQELAITEAYQKYNGILGAIGEATPTGITTGLDNALEATRKFTKEVAGDGSSTKIKTEILPVKELTQEQKDWNDAWFDIKNNTTAAQDELEARLVQKYGSLQRATDKGWGDLVGASQKGGEDFQASLDDLKYFDAIENLNTNITGALREAAAGIAISFAEMAGSALAGGEGFENAGKAFGLLLAEMLSNIGKALITFATLILIAETSIFEAPLVAIAAGIAAVAAGAYLKTKLSDSKSKGFYTGGVVQGRGGVDAIPARLTAGEMILNKRQQANMFGMINGTNTGRNFNRNFATSGANTNVTGQLVGKLRGSDIDIAARLGSKTNNKFRGR